MPVTKRYTDSQVIEINKAKITNFSASYPQFTTSVAISNSNAFIIKIGRATPKMLVTITQRRFLRRPLQLQTKEVYLIAMLSIYSYCEGTALLFGTDEENDLIIKFLISPLAESWQTNLDTVELDIEYAAYNEKQIENLFHGKIPTMQI